MPNSLCLFLYTINKGKNMSIMDIQIQKKIEVLLRLLNNNETLEVASSKAGLSLAKSSEIIAR
jgi:hypothetical protein